MKFCRVTAGLEVVPNEAISQLPSLDQNSIAAIFGFLPQNSKVLAVKSLSTFWRDWAMLRLKDRANEVSGWGPLWALKQRGIEQLTPGQQDAVMRSLAAAGDQEGLTWMHQQLGRLPTSVAMAAAATGQLGVLQWAKKHGCSTGGRHVFQAAACAGHLHVIEWLEGEGDLYYPSTQVAQRAADFSGNVHMLNWARGKGYATDPILCRSAVAAGNLEALKGVQEGGTALGSEVCFIAAQHGQIEVLKWLKEEVGETWDAEYCLKGATMYNQLRVLHWAVKEGIPLLQDTCVIAAFAGHLEVLQFARQQGCPWGSDTTTQAGRGGHLQVLQWALEHGCRWTHHAYYDVAAAGKLDVLKWALKERLPGEQETCDGAALGGQLKVLKWAMENGLYCNSHTCWLAVNQGHVEVLKWAREHECSWDRGACIAEAEKAGLDLTGVPGFFQPIYSNPGFQHRSNLRRAWGWVCRQFSD